MNNTVMAKALKPGKRLGVRCNGHLVRYTMYELTMCLIIMSYTSMYFGLLHLSLLLINLNLIDTYNIAFSKRCSIYMMFKLIVNLNIILLLLHHKLSQLKSTHSTFMLKVN